MASLTEHWLLPEVGWYKVNADGSFSQDDGHGGGGVVVRDHHGGFKAGACHFFPIVTDPERAELLACRRGAQLAKELGVRKVIIETDCLSAVVKIGKMELDRSGHGPVTTLVSQLFD